MNFVLRLIATNFACQRSAFLCANLWGFNLQIRITCHGRHIACAAIGPKAYGTRVLMSHSLGRYDVYFKSVTKLANRAFYIQIRNEVAEGFGGEGSQDVGCRTLKVSNVQLFSMVK